MQNRLYDEIAKKIATSISKKGLDIGYEKIYKKVKTELQIKPRFQKQDIQQIE